MAASSKSINVLMARIGPVMGLADVVEHEDGAAWTLDVDENLALLAEYDATSGRLALSAETASPPWERRAETYELLLLFNAQWRETGGVRMALEVSNAPVVQTIDVDAENLDLASFAAVIGDFIAKAAAWRRIIADGAGLDQISSGDELEEALRPSRGAVRV